MIYAIIGVVIVIAVIYWYASRRPTVGFTQRQQEQFLTQVAAYFTSRNLPAEFNDGAINIRDDANKAITLGLDNLAQMCRQSPETEWEHLIAVHFDNCLDTMRDAARLDAELKDFANAREQLMVRLIAKDALDDPPTLVYREDIPGLYTYLAIDLPTTVMSVHPERLADWGQEEDELFTIGLDNVRRTCAPEVFQDTVNDAAIVGLTSDNFFTAAHALMLPEHKACLGTFGAIVALPTRHTIVCHPINDMNIVQGVNALAIMAHGIFQDGPGSLTPKLYWYDNGRFTELPYKMEGKKLNFYPPENFVHLLSHLAERDPATHG